MDTPHLSEEGPEPHPPERQPGATESLDYSSEPLSDLKLQKTTQVCSKRMDIIALVGVLVTLVGESVTKNKVIPW